MATAIWTPDAGWHAARIEPYGPIPLDPAAAVLHYAQEIFEGLKAYRHADGSIWAFRPEANAERMLRSARRLALPELPVEDFVGAVSELVATDVEWVPGGHEQSLYLRPFMFASEAFLGVRPANEVRFVVIASPVGAYFTGGIRPVSIWLSQNYTRAAVGGMGAAKTGGNYAASLAAQLEAGTHGCDQVVFLDAVERRWVEELGGMNVYLVYADGRLVTPSLTGTILEGVTRDSILALATEQGLRVEERRIGIDEWRDGVTERRGQRGVRLRHRRGDHAGRPARVGRRRGCHAAPRRRRRERRPDRSRRRKHPLGAARHAVRPRRGHPRLDAPPRLTGVSTRHVWALIVIIHAE